MKYLRTSDLGKAVGVHPNTVRRYGERGLLPPVERSPSGYRLFTERHLDCLRLARVVYGSPYAGSAIQQSGMRIVATTVGGELEEVRALAYRHLALVQSERNRADVAAGVLERWALGEVPAGGTDTATRPLQIGEAAQLLGVTIDILRNWDRNGLIDIPRDPANGYRRYGAPQISRLRVIGTLSRAGYSLSAILRMLIQLDRGDKNNLRRALDTPRPDEDAFLASDRLISTLAALEQQARRIIVLVEDMIRKQTPAT
jgi:DNA-binding transcriptional MerR regulator